MYFCSCRFNLLLLVIPKNKCLVLNPSTVRGLLSRNGPETPPEVVPETVRESVSESVPETVYEADHGNNVSTIP